MTEERHGPQSNWHLRLVVVAIPDETTQAMVCVALEQNDFSPVATAGLPEAVDLIAHLPAHPVALVVMAPRWDTSSPLHRVGAECQRRGVPTPATIVLHAPGRPAGEPPHRLAPPDLAGMLQAAEALAAV